MEKILKFLVKLENSVHLGRDGIMTDKTKSNSGFNCNICTQFFKTKNYLKTFVRQDRTNLSLFSVEGPFKVSYDTVVNPLKFMI